MSRGLPEIARAGLLNASVIPSPRDFIRMNPDLPAVLVSGASSGIGRETALLLARSGFRVFAGVRNEAASSDLLAQGLENIIPLFLDITKEESIRAMGVRLANENLAGIVNNAGSALLGPMEFLPLPEIRDQFELNLFGHIAVTQATLPALRKSRGRIVNISSISGKIGFPFAGAYVGSKFALEGLTDSWRRELQPQGIAVTLIEPGNISTPIWSKSFEQSRTVARQFKPAAFELYGERLMASKRSVNRMSTPDAVAKVVLRALTARQPKTRYVVGRDAHVYLLMRRFLPDRLLDRFV